MANDSTKTELKKITMEDISEFTRAFGEKTLNFFKATGSFISKNAEKVHEIAKEKLGPLVKKVKNKAKEIKEYLGSEEFQQDLEQAKDEFMKIASSAAKAAAKFAITNPLSRKVIIKSVSLMIKKFNPNNEKHVAILHNFIESCQLLNPEFGETLQTKDLANLAEKLSQNPEFQEESISGFEYLNESPEGRKAVIQKVSGMIKELNPNDERSIEMIGSIIGTCELFNHTDYESFSSKEDLAIFAKKISNNPKYKEDVKTAVSILKNYPNVKSVESEENENTKKTQEKFIISDSKSNQTASPLPHISSVDKQEPIAKPLPHISSPNKNNPSVEMMNVLEEQGPSLE